MGSRVTFHLSIGEGGGGGPPKPHRPTEATARSVKSSSGLESVAEGPHAPAPPPAGGAAPSFSQGHQTLLCQSTAVPHAVVCWAELLPLQSWGHTPQLPQDGPLARSWSRERVDQSYLGSALRLARRCPLPRSCCRGRQGPAGTCCPSWSGGPVPGRMQVRVWDTSTSRLCGCVCVCVCVHA